MLYQKYANEIWKEFLETKITEYTFKRNYDYGPQGISSVSKLSPYISHRVILEYQIIEDVLERYKGNNVKKFIEEVYWRIYWKGWLENKSCVWDNFISKKDFEYNEYDYENALEGKTELPFFNSWIEELKDFNYLHNHTRMWFASTWIFNLGLPWQLGARLFFKHLYDGDAASNLLSWRWVAGLHTKGKKYVFSPQNLKKFSNNRFNVEKIEYKDVNISDNFEMVFSSDIFNCQFLKKSEYLVMFENDLNEDTLRNLIIKYKKVFLVLLDQSHRQINISDSVLVFKKKLTSEFAKRFLNIHKISSLALPQELRDIKQFDLIYPSVGDNNDFINRFKLKHAKKVNVLVREEDLYSWKFAKKGFFKFKENIESINKYLQRPKRLW